MKEITIVDPYTGCKDYTGTAADLNAARRDLRAEIAGWSDDHLLQLDPSGSSSDFLAYDIRRVIDGYPDKVVAYAYVETV